MGVAKQSVNLHQGVARGPFGLLPGGGLVEAITLARADGISVTILTYGASLQTLHAPDRDGQLADLVLGHGTLPPYLEKPQYFGSTVGRVANRIGGGRFRLEGVDHRVPPNDGPNALHGGAGGFDKANWEVLGLEEGDRPAVTLGLTSPDGDQGFPGTLRVEARFALPEPATLEIAYRATTDRPTLVNLTSHAYWNLAGEGAPGGAMDHRLQIMADHFLPTDATAIPTGEIRPVAATPFDFRDLREVGARVREAGDEQIRFGRGYDHNWVLRAPEGAGPRLAARLVHPASGRVMDLSTDQPGLQFYSGNFLDGTSVGKSGRLYRQGDGLVLEPQQFPDTPNRPEFGSVRLEPGNAYAHRILFRFGLTEEGE